MCGGGSAVPGMAARLVRELHARLLSTTAPKLLQLPEYMPPHTLACASWMGGAVLAKVRTSPADEQGNACKSKRDIRSFTLHTIAGCLLQHRDSSASTAVPPQLWMDT